MRTKAVLLTIWDIVKVSFLWMILPTAIAAGVVGAFALIIYAFTVVTPDYIQNYIIFILECLGVGIIIVAVFRVPVEEAYYGIKKSYRKNVKRAHGQEE